MTQEHDDGLIVIRIGCPDEMTALDIREEVMSGSLSPVAHLTDVRSSYRWKGETVERKETVLEFRTTQSRFDAIADIVQSLHPFETPSIIGIPIVAITDSYAEWLRCG